VQMLIQNHYLVISRIRVKINWSKYVPNKENNKIQYKHPKTNRGQDST
jgi:hypothetical protein